MTTRTLKIIEEMSPSIIDSESIYWCVIKDGLIWFCKPIKDAPEINQ